MQRECVRGGPTVDGRRRWCHRSRGTSLGLQHLENTLCPFHGLLVVVRTRQDKEGREGVVGMCAVVSLGSASKNNLSQAGFGGFRLFGCAWPRGRVECTVVIGTHVAACGHRFASGPRKDGETTARMVAKRPGVVPHSIVEKMRRESAPHFFLVLYRKICRRGQRWNGSWCYNSPHLNQCVIESF